MDHATFVQRSDALYGFRSLPVARAIWGYSGYLRLALVAAVLFLPAATFCWWCVAAQRYAGLIWMVPIFFASRSGNRTGVGCAVLLLLFFAGAGLTEITGDYMHLVGPLAVFVMWTWGAFVHARLYQVVLRRLRASSALFEQLRRAEVLMLIDTAEHAPVSDCNLSG